MSPLLFHPLCLRSNMRDFFLILFIVVVLGVILGCGPSILEYGG
jgi:hypothetical protein